MLTLPVGPRDHSRGLDDALVTLVEYGDFECPQCALAYPIIKRIDARFGERLRFIFRHFPITSSHPHAQHAAEAAEWAASLGAERTERERAFWRMHDAFFERPNDLADGKIVERTIRLGLPGGRLVAAWAAHEHLPHVKEDFASGLASGVTGTPAFFIDGARHEASWDEEALARAIEGAAAQRSG